MNRKKPLIAFAALTLALLSGAALAVPNFKASTREAMKKKLRHSQMALEAIAMERFQDIESNARALSRLADTEAWQAIESPEYQAYTAEFRRQTDAMREAARKKNIDGAALAYVQMTVTCVNCHKHVRNKKRVARL